MIALALLLVLLCVIFASMARYYWLRRKLYAFSLKLSGPLSLPLIGNAWLFACNQREIFNKIEWVVKSYKHPSRFWLGPKLVIIFGDLKHAEKLMGSTKLTQKSDIYKFIKEFGGNGLVTSSGETWKSHRKIIQPMLSLRFSKNAIPIMQWHANIMIKKLSKKVDADLFDVLPYFNQCCFDVMGEIICGTNPDTQNGKNIATITAFENLYENVFEQMMKPWLYPEMIYKFSSNKHERIKILEDINRFMYMAIGESNYRIKSGYFDDQTSPIIDQLNEYRNNNTDVLCTVEFKDHIATLLEASQDTTSFVSSMCCLCFGMYPEYQEKAAEEIRDVFGVTPREVLEVDLGRLKYLEMCIKDVLRLAPIAPFILRKTLEEIVVGEYTIPPGCEVLIPIFNIHRDPTQWQVPLHFYPDHFLPEAVAKRHPYAYIPFSAGPRNCIGKMIAMPMLKLLMANVLQRFRFEAEGKFHDIKFRTDISIRAVDGYNVRIFNRHWN